MKNKLVGALWILGTALSTLCISSLNAAEVLTLEKYLTKVRENHTGYQASRNISEGSGARAKEADLLFAPQLFLNAQKTSDAKPNANPTFQGEKTLFDSYSLGVSKLTSFGLQTKLSYNVNYTEIIGAGAAFVPVPQFYDAKPVLELSHSLWRNGFGRETQITAELQEATAKATAFNESFKGQLILQEAETAYWRLALAREIVQVQKSSLDRFQKIEKWIAGRVRQDLTDKAELYQAQAALEARELELQTASDEEKAAVRAFSSLHCCPVRSEIERELRAARVAGYAG